MIAKIIIEGGKFAAGYVRGGDALQIHESYVSWPGKWTVSIQDGILCQSTRRSSKGENTVYYGISCIGNARLWLETNQEGQWRLLREECVFRHQSNFDGELFLVYNGNGFRSAFYHSNELIEWKKQRGLINIVRKDPNKLAIREKLGSSSYATELGDLSMFKTGNRTILTDGKVRVDSTVIKGGQSVHVAHLEEATWAILSKERKNRTERVLITQSCVFDLDVPSEEAQKKALVRTYDYDYLLK